MELKNYIRDIKDFPKQGIIFKDLSHLWQDKDAFAYSISSIANLIKNEKIDLIVGAEARGFLVGSALALKINSGFIPVRKPGKLPYKTISATYQLEYGTDTLCMNEDAIKKGQNVVIVDDLIATGGTCEAMIDLVEKLGGNIVCIAFLVELEFLKGREAIAKKGNYPVHSIIKY